MALHNFSRRAFSPAAEPIVINWRRGLFRVWLLISAGWVMGWTIYLIMYSLQGGYLDKHLAAGVGKALRVIMNGDRIDIQASVDLKG